MSCRAKNLFLYALFTLSVSMCLLVPSWSVVGVGSHDDKHIILMGGLFLGGLYSFFATVGHLFASAQIVRLANRFDAQTNSQH